MSNNVKKLNNTNNIKVLMYHRVVDELPDKYSHWHYVTTSEFRKQLNLIDRLGFTTITFTDYHLYTQGKLTLPRKPIILTFDDGYANTFDNAIPIMMNLGMKGVIYIMGNRLLKSANWDRVDEGDECSLMTNDQVRAARDMGFEIGSHSMRHVPLAELSEQDAAHTIRKSKQEIELVLNEPIHSFAYPYGVMNTRIKQLVSEAGYLFACGVYTGSPKFGETCYDFRRIAINNDTSFRKFAIKMVIPYQYVEWLYHQIKSMKQFSSEEYRPEEKPVGEQQHAERDFSNWLHEQNA